MTGYHCSPQATMTRKALEAMTWHVMARDQGQIVEVAYAADCDGFYRRMHDRSQGMANISYDYAAWDDDVGEGDSFEPWNGRLPDHGEWEPVAVA
jgi:hypothetical protein